MKQWVIAGLLAGSIGVAGAAAQQPATGQPSGQQATTTKSSGQQPARTTKATTPGKTAGQQPSATGAETTTPEQTAKKPAHRARRAAAADTNAEGTHTAPKTQPATAPDPSTTVAAMALGRVHIPAGITADGKPLAAGMYDVRLTADEAKPDAVGTTEKLERWVEFVQRGQVKGKEVVSIVPESEIKLVQKDTPPRPGAPKVERLKGGDYVRVWINKGGNHFLIHLPTGTSASTKQ